MALFIIISPASGVEQQNTESKQTKRKKKTKRLHLNIHPYRSSYEGTSSCAAGIGPASPAFVPWGGFFSCCGVCRASRGSSTLKLVRWELAVPGTENIASVDVLWPLQRRIREVTDNGGDFEPRELASSVPRFSDPSAGMSSSASSAELSPCRFSSQDFGRVICLG